jgi:hypothetical protein
MGAYQRKSWLRSVYSSQLVGPDTILDEKRFFAISMSGTMSKLRRLSVEHCPNCCHVVNNARYLASFAEWEAVVIGPGQLLPWTRFFFTPCLM